MKTVKITRYQRDVLEQLKREGAYLQVKHSGWYYVRMVGTHLYNGVLNYRTFIRLRDLGLIVQNGRTDSEHEKWILAGQVTA